MGFAQELTKLRAKKGVSLQALANEVGVSKTYIWQLEKGASIDPSMEIVKKLADYFNVSMQSLWSEDPESDSADPLALAMFRKVGDLDDFDKEAVLQMIDTMLKRQRKRKNEVRQSSSK